MRGVLFWGRPARSIPLFFAEHGRAALMLLIRKRGRANCVYEDAAREMGIVRQLGQSSCVRRSESEILGRTLST